MCAVQVEMSPLENASEVIENKTLQLRTLIAQCQTRQMQNINPLTMCLNGVIDAAVNGGLARYQEVPPPRSISLLLFISPLFVPLRLGIFSAHEILCQGF